MVHPIHFGTYNIRNGRNRGLESALSETSLANIYLGLFQQTKRTKRVYMRESSGYKVVAMEAPSGHSGGVSVFYRAEEHFSVKSIHTYGENVVNFQLASGNRRWYIVECCLAPENALTIEDVIAVISKWPQGATLMVVGDFNTNLAAQ